MVDDMNASALRYLPNVRSLLGTPGTTFDNSVVSYSQCCPQWKYVEHSTGEFELYDLQVDPYELSSVHNDPRYASTRHALASRLAGLRNCAGNACRQWQLVPGPAS
jgi:hypothetical protein